MNRKKDMEDPDKKDKKSSQRLKDVSEEVQILKQQVEELKSQLRAIIRNLQNRNPCGL